MTTTKDTAIDNLWMSTDDVRGYNLTPSPNGKLVENKSASYKTKDTKLTGSVVYFISKDAKGKPVGKPVRLLYIATNNEYKYIPADKVEPYYENILKNKNRWISLGGSDIVAKAEEKLGVKTYVGDVASNFSGDTDLSNSDKLDLDFSSLIGYRGGITRDIKEKLNFVQETLDVGEQQNFDLGFNGYSNASGIGSAASLVDPNKQIYTPKELEDLYSKSGSKKTFKDWLASDSGKSIIDSIGNLAAVLLAGQNIQAGNTPTNSVTTVGGSNPNVYNTNNNNDDDNETKILGMSPLTFGIVAFISIAAIATTAIVLVKRANK